jgi:uncharacterized protein YegL
MASETNVRRLPVYLVLDVSGSMFGEPLDAVRSGVKQLLADLRSDPHALETVWLSVIVFGSQASQTVPLTDLAVLGDFPIDGGGSTNLAAAVECLDKAIAAEVRKTSKTQKGDYKPIVFLMTDGFPDGGWEAPADAFKAKRAANVIACAAGPGAATEPLKRITETVVQLGGLEPAQLKAFFKWVSSSVTTTSAQLGVPGTPVGLPAPPPAITIVP